MHPSLFTISERRKKTIQDNIDLLKVEKKVRKLEDAIQTCKEQLGTMGADAARVNFETARSNIQTLWNKIERFNGRMQGLQEQKRNLKRKLVEPEYKNIDERQRMKMIEHETTNIVVTDLDKYYDALDKALLRYHGMKISDINKIIRELWTLCYKGEGEFGFSIVLCNQPCNQFADRHSLTTLVMHDQSSLIRHH